MPRFLLVVAAFLLLLVVSPSPADAHASLVSTSPKDGSRIASAPSSVELTFGEDVGQAFVAVTAPDGTAVKTSPAHIAGPRVTAGLATSDERGRYSVSYRVVSADGHPVSGTFTFTTTSGRAVTQKDAPETKPFVERHTALITVGLALALLAIGLMLAPVARQRRQ